MQIFFAAATGHGAQVLLDLFLMLAAAKLMAEVFERLRQPAVSDRLADAVDGPVAPVLEAARLAVTLRRTRAGHLDHLRASVDPALPLLFVPYLFTRGHGLRTTGQVAEALSAELGY